VCQQLEPRQVQSDRIHPMSARVVNFDEGMTRTTCREHASSLTSLGLNGPTLYTRPHSSDAELRLQTVLQSVAVNWTSSCTDATFQSCLKQAAAVVPDQEVTTLFKVPQNGLQQEQQRPSRQRLTPISAVPIIALLQPHDGLLGWAVEHCTDIVVIVCCLLGRALTRSCSAARWAASWRAPQPLRRR
jgi:hypothetical protein